MAEGNGSSQHGSEQGIQATPDFLGSHQGLQPALYPLPRHGDGVDVARRPADRQGARHHLADCRLRQSDPGAQRRRAAVPSPTFSNWPNMPTAADCAWRWPPTERW